MKSTLFDAIEYLERYSFSFLETRYKALVSIDDYSYKIVEDSLRDYYLSSFLRRQPYCPNHLKNINSIMPPNKIVDELWHLHIIYTKEYFKFSEELFGTYLHHNPTSEEEREKTSFSDELNKLYLFGNYIKDYRNYSIEDLNVYKTHSKFSLLSQCTDFLNEMTYEEVLSKGNK